MIKKSFCKINLSLAVLARRADGFSQIETVMYPVRGIFDTVEIVESDREEFVGRGIEVDCAPQDNLCVKAYRLMRQEFDLPPVSITLDKHIPFGAGLGAGSANAVAVVELCNDLFGLGLSGSKLKQLVARLGSDTPFFVDCVPAVASGRGEILTPIDIDLAGYYIYMFKPEVGVSTREAYALVEPNIPPIAPSDAVKHPVERWKEVCVNDFEAPIFGKLPVLASIKDNLYRSGAVYASMSGSGSTVYGFFKEPVELDIPYFLHSELL